MADDDFEGCVLGLLDLDRNSGQSKFNIKVNQLFDASVQDVI